MAFPPALRETLQQRLGGPLDQVQPVYGGDINEAARFESGGTPYFVKWSPSAPPEMFAAEADGLRRLAAVQAIRVPAVIDLGTKEGACPAFLVLEWIETRARRADDAALEQFGVALAAQHRHTAAAHGLERDNFLGRLPQPNRLTPGWTAFYGEQRIGFQVRLARHGGLLPPRREKMLARLVERLPEWLDDATMPPSLLHGDLWSGNYLVDTQGQAVVFDPAVYYGHREMDLAMSELFGGFSPRFYAAYHAAYPLEGYEERRALYQLYYLLAHLNLFGESYGGQVEAMAARYVGW